MGKDTIIAWADNTFNIAWGCVKVGDGCKHCYADTLAKRYGKDGCWGPRGTRRTFGAKHWAEPVKWNRKSEQSGEPARVFTSSMCDVFEDNEVVSRERGRLWDLIAATPWLEWLVLTKRADRIAQCLPADWGAGYCNVWLGVSVEHEGEVWRIAELSKVPAQGRFLSYEPALGPLAGVDLGGIGWVIYGGESGPKYRQHDVQWARDIRDQCDGAGIPFFYKQSPGIRTEMGIELDGEMVREYPAMWDRAEVGGLFGAVG